MAEVGRMCGGIGRGRTLYAREKSSVGHGRMG